MVHTKLLDEQSSEEIDVEQVVIFSESLLVNVARAWQDFPLEQKQRFQQVLFPKGLIFSSGGFGTAETSLIFNYLEPKGRTETSLASPAGFEPAAPAPPFCRCGSHAAEGGMQQRGFCFAA